MREVVVVLFVGSYFFKVVFFFIEVEVFMGIQISIFVFVQIVRFQDNFNFEKYNLGLFMGKKKVYLFVFGVYMISYLINC